MTTLSIFIIFSLLVYIGYCAIMFFVTFFSALYKIEEPKDEAYNKILTNNYKMALAQGEINKHTELIIKKASLLEYQNYLEAQKQLLVTTKIKLENMKRSLV